MTSDELEKKWDELTQTYIAKEAKLEAFIQKWLDDELALDNKQVEGLIDQTAQEIDRLKKEAEIVINECIRKKEEEMLKEQNLIDAKRTVRSQFNISPDEMIFTGGVLSPNASESHLTGRNKTPEELEVDRQYALAEIRSRVAKKEISLAEASKLKQDVNLAYGYSGPANEASTEMHR